MDPNGVAVNMTAARVPGKASPQREQTNILANLIDVCELKAISPDNLHIRVVDEPLFYGGYMLNPEGSDGVVYLRRYTYQTGFTPKLIYHKGVHQEWFDLYKSELRSLWNRGVEWTCSD